MKLRGAHGLAWRGRFWVYKFWPFIASMVAMTVVLTLLLVSWLAFQERGQLAKLVRAAEDQAAYNSRLLEQEQQREGERNAVIDDAIRRIVAQIEATVIAHDQRDAEVDEQLLRLLRELRAQQGPPGPQGPAGADGRDGAPGSAGRDGKDAPPPTPPTTPPTTTPCVLTLLSC